MCIKLIRAILQSDIISYAYMELGIYACFFTCPSQRKNHISKVDIQECALYGEHSKRKWCKKINADKMMHSDLSWPFCQDCYSTSMGQLCLDALGESSFFTHQKLLEVQWVYQTSIQGSPLETVIHHVCLKVQLHKIGWAKMRQQQDHLNFCNTCPSQTC